MSKQNIHDTPADAVHHNKPAPGVPFFTPAQEPAAGTALAYDGTDNKEMPKLFTPIKIRGMAMHNRIVLSPLDQYSCSDGHQTPWHMAHLGGIIKRGPGLSIVEASAVTPEGRVTPEDSGIWQDSQIEPMRRVVEFAHSQGQKIALQLAHAGRKASTVAPWIAASEMATEAHGGWPTRLVAPSALPYKQNHNTPTAMTLQDIADFKTAWAAAVKRAMLAGFDCVEIHAAHGYLLHEFMSPASNTRTDSYGGSFANRTRLVLEIAQLTRSLIPDSMPLFVRVSGTDWLEDHPAFQTSDSTLDGAKSWTPGQTVALAPLLSSAGVDVLDVSSGGIHPAQKVVGAPAYQAPFAMAVKAALPKDDPMVVMTVGAIQSGALADALLEGTAVERFGVKADKDVALDLVAVGRGFIRNPGLVWAFAEELGVEVKLPNQIGWGFKGRGKKSWKGGKDAKGKL